MRSQAELASPLWPPQDAWRLEHAWPRRLPQLKIRAGGAIAFRMPISESRIIGVRQAPVEQAERVTL